MQSVVPTRFVIVPALLVGALLLSSGLAAQSRPANGSIFGQVIDASTGQPIPGAIVLLDDARPNIAGPRPVDEHQPGPDGALPPDRVMANGEGLFVFHNLPASSYRLEAAASGYLNGSYGQSRPAGPHDVVELGDNAHVSGVRLKLWKCASLSGRVVDEAGEPAARVAVRAYRVSIEGTRRLLDRPTEGLTNDRGEYRLGSLGSGSYVVSIPQTTMTMPLPFADAVGDLRTPASYELVRELARSAAPTFAYRLQRGVRVNDLEVVQTESTRPPIAPSSDPAVTLLYRTIFFQAAASSDDAAVLTLGAGDDRAGIDLRLRASPGVTITGTASGPDGPARHLGLHLIPVNARGEPDALDAAQAVTTETGTFTFFGVSSGQYLLRMYRSLPSTHMGDRAPSPDRPLFADQPLSVGDRDIDGVAVTLREGARVSGRLVFEGADAAATQRLQQDTNVMLVNLATAQQFIPAWCNANGTFVTDGAAPGRYTIVAGPPPGWILLSATRAGRDLDDAPLELQTADLDGIVVTLTNRPTHARVTVRAADAAGAPDLDATVVAFPASYSAWIEHGMAGRRLRTASPTRTGSVTIDGLPPGDYIIAAVPGDAWPMPHTTAFFDALSRVGTRATLTSGQTVALDVTVRQIR